MNWKYLSFGIIISLLVTGCVSFSSSQKIDLNNNFNFNGRRLSEPQEFEMVSKAITIDSDNNPNTITLRLNLHATPIYSSNSTVFKYTCNYFSYQKEKSQEIELLSLKNWSYRFTESGIDSNNQVFGIDHHIFDNLTDPSGNDLDISVKYSVYNAFIDFHSLTDLFAQPTSAGSGIQNLKHIGDQIIHTAAYTKAPTHLGKSLKDGSYFKNGKITLNLEGLSIINNRHSAIIGYDSGTSSFEMIMQLAPNFEVITTGSSHYSGNIHKDLNDNWVNKVTLKEIVISQTIIPPPAQNKINATIMRNIIIDRVFKP